MTTTPRLARRIMTGFSALAATALLSGCAIFSPMATENMYNPGDGLPVGFGEVEVRDIILVGTEEGAPAVISAYVVNNSDEAQTVAFTAEGGTPVEVEVPANSATQISAPGDAVELESLPGTPGSMIPLTVQVGEGAPASLNAPSVTPENPMYADYADGAGQS